MSACDSLRRLISPYIDGELVGEDRSAFEAHVASCPDCSRSLEQERTVVRAVRASLPLYKAPRELRARVDGLVRAPPALPARSWIPAGLAAAAVIATLGVLLGDGLVRRAAPARQPASEFAALATDTHLRYARGQLPLEVETDRPESVSRWFSGRVPFHLTLPDYPVGPGERKFYRLEGGRLVSFKDDYAAYVAYRMEGQPVSLLVTSAERVRPAGGELVRSGALTFHLESLAGLTVITWSDKGLTYALASGVAVGGARSCLVCHGSPEERHRIEAFPQPPTS
jgi:anti-sigma factor (TIGR02949 family)